MTEVSSQTSSGAYEYTGTITLKETAGVGATINTVTIRLFKNGSLYAETDPFGPEAWVGSYSTIGPRGTLTSNYLVASDTSPDRHADRVDAVITFTDDSQTSGSLTLTAPVPALMTTGPGTGDRLGLVAGPAIRRLPGRVSQ